MAQGAGRPDGGVRSAVAGGDIDQSTTQVEAQRDSYNAHHQTWIVHNYGDTTARPNSPAAERSVLVWEHIHSQAATATPPPGLDGALATLADHRILILVGDRGQGRNTACLLLAHRLAESLGHEFPVERLALDDDDTLEKVAPGRTGGLTLVDLVDVAPDQRVRRLNELGGIRPTMDDGYLVLTVPGADSEYSGTRYPSWVSLLGRPDGGTVFRDLLGDRLPAGLVDELSADNWFTAQLGVAWPPRVAHLVTLTVASFTGGKTTAAEIAHQTRAALADWTDELAAELTKPDPWLRSLMMAAALLEGADPATVVAAARALIDCAGYRELDDPHPLVAPSVVKRLRDIDGIVADQDSVTFDRPEFGAAVLPHVWTEYPELRPALRRWLTQLPGGLPMDRAALERLSDRVFGLSRHHGHGIAIHLASRWASADSGGGSVGTRRSLAVRLLVSAGTDPVIGRAVRDQLWQWAHHSQQPGMQRVVAEVCGSQYGEMFPRNALTRLKHLSARENPDVRRAVVAAITEIGVRIGPYRLFGYLTDWLKQLRPEQAETVAMAVGQVLSTDAVRAGLRTVPNIGIRYGTADGALIGFWRSVLDVMPYTLVAGMVGAWLGALAALPTRRQQVLVEQLVAAAAGDYRRVGQLVYAARPQNVPDTPYGEQLFVQVRTRLDEMDPAKTDLHAWQ